MFCLRRATARILSSPSPILSVYTKQRTFTTLKASSLCIARPAYLPSFQRRYVSEKVKENDTLNERIDEPAAPETTSAEEIDLAEIEPANPEAEAPSYLQGGRTMFGEDRSTLAAADRAIPQEPQPFSRDPLFAPSNFVYIGNLYYDVTSDILRQEFGDCGPIKDVKLILDHRGLSKGFGFIEFEDNESAKKAIERHNLRVMEGRRITVQYAAQPKTNDAPRSSAGRSLPHDPRDPSSTLFVGNISYEVSDKDLNGLFRPLKNALEIRVAIDRRSGQPRGFAHVDFSDIESAQAAKELLLNKIVLGRRLRVDFAAASASTRGRIQNAAPGDDSS